MIIQVRKIFVYMGLIAATSFSAFASEKEEIIENNSSLKEKKYYEIDIRDAEAGLKLAPVPQGNLPCPRFYYYESFDNKFIQAYKVKQGEFSADPLMEEKLDIIDGHYYFDKENEFAVIYNNTLDTTIFFVNPNEKEGIVAICNKNNSDHYTFELEKGQKSKLTTTGSGSPYLCRRDDKKKLERLEEIKKLSLLEQMQKMTNNWVIVDKKNNIFKENAKSKYDPNREIPEYKRSLSRIANNKLYFFSFKEEWKGKFIPVSCSDVKRGNFTDKEFTFASSKNLITINGENRVGTSLLCGLEDLQLDMTEVQPYKDQNSNFMLYGGNDSVNIKEVKTFNNISISELEKVMLPGNQSQNGFTSGFLGVNQSLLEVIINDNDCVRNELGLTHLQLVEPLKRVIKSYTNNYIESGEPFMFNKNIFIFNRSQARGIRSSPFSDNLPGTSYDLILYNLSAGTVLSFSWLEMGMIEKYGFYLGNVPRRVDPKTIISVFPWLKK